MLSELLNQEYLLSPYSTQELCLPELHPRLPSIAWSPPGSPPAILTGLICFLRVPVLSVLFKCKFSLGFLVSPPFWATNNS